MNVQQPPANSPCRATAYARRIANLLTDNKPPYDPAMGTYQLRALLCRMAPIGLPTVDTKKMGV